MNGVDFKDALFEEGQKVLFNVDNLSVTSFISTNVTEVRFTNLVKWPDIGDISHLMYLWSRSPTATIPNLFDVLSNKC